MAGLSACNRVTWSHPIDGRLDISEYRTPPTALLSLVSTASPVVDDLGKAHPSLATWSGDSQTSGIWEFELRGRHLFSASGSRLTSAERPPWQYRKLRPQWKVSTSEREYGR